MQENNVSRRDFNRLSLTALGGLLAGLGLAGEVTAEDDKAPGKKDPKKPLLLQEPHVCRGLNICKAKGKGGKNDCAGTSACATAKAHTCGGENDCAGLGGCGEKPGENACKGMGKCHVPLSKKAWPKAREHFEAAMKKAGKKVGAAPK
jgi:hypothetical protein